MNVPPSEGNEGIVDIFVLSGSSAETRLLEENLEQDGYRVSRFDGGAQLFEALGEGNPNLLICDATSLGQEGYDTSRQIKTGESTWMIPVLILTRTTGLADLLAILDCNADNFISFPCDPAYFLSFVDGMLTTPVERQTPDLIKTQFKIQHDDRVYVVTADRRKLLEFLLSSFETAVTISADLQHAQEESKELSDSFTKARQTSVEQARSLIALNESLRQKEEAEQSLSAELASRSSEIAEKDNDIARLQGELEKGQALITQAEERIRSMELEHETVVDSHRANIDTLSRQVSDLSSELEQKMAALETTQHDLEDQATRCANAECTIAELAPRKEEAEKALQALRLESEKIWAMLASEKDRALTSEQELETLRQSKEKADEESALAIAGLKEEVTLRDEELARVSRNLEEETIRADHTEGRVASLQHEKEDAENALGSIIGTLRTDLSELEAKYTAATAALEEGDLRVRSIEEELELATADLEKSEVRAREVSESLNEAESALAVLEEQNATRVRDLATSAAERDRLAAELQSATDAAVEARSFAEDERRRRESAEAGLLEMTSDRALQDTKIRELSSALEELRESIETAGQEKVFLQREIADLTSQHETSEESIRSISHALVEARGEAAEEQRRRELAENGLATLVADKEGYERESKRYESDAAALRSEMEQARSALASAEGQRSALEQDLATAIRERESVRSNLQAAEQALDESRSALDLDRSRIQALERQLVIVIREKEEATEEVRRSGSNAQGELELRSTELAKARQEIAGILAKLRTAEEELRTAGIKTEQERGNAHTIEVELEKVRGMLRAEQQLRVTAEDGLKDLHQQHERLGSDLRTTSETSAQREEELSESVQKLAAELQAVLAREETLKAHVEEIDREKRSVEQKLETFSLEIQQARSALADEWEDHMNADERVAAAMAGSEQLKTAEEKLLALNDELQQARTALADEWEDHMNAAERLAEADRKNELLRKSLGPSPIPRPVPKPVQIIETEHPLPVTIKPFTLALARADIPEIHPVHDREIPGGANQELQRPAEKETPPPVEKWRSTADLRIEDLFEDEPGGVSMAPVQPHQEIVAESATDKAEEVVEPEPPEVISEEVPISFDPVIPEEPGTTEEPETVSAEEPEPETEVSEDIDEHGEDHLNDIDHTGGYLSSAYAIPSGMNFNRKQWFDLFAWARHTDSLSSDQRMQIIRMGRLIQRGRKLTIKQEEQVREIITLAQAHGYQFS